MNKRRLNIDIQRKLNLGNSHCDLPFRLITQGLVFLIMIYRKCISPALGAHCRFYPSCSQYCSEVLKKYGLAQGLKKSVIRLCKCQPFCKGGVDLP